MSAARQLTLALPHKPALGRENFFVSASNADAVALIDRWPDWPHAFLALAGPAGSGKTHLVHVWSLKAHARIVQASELSVASLRDLALAPAIAVEDADRALEQGLAPELLFHHFNQAANNRQALVLTAREAPVRWPVALPDLASRLATVPVATLAPPDDALLAAVMVKLFSDRQLRVGDDVVSYLLARLDRSVAAVSQAVTALDEAALAAKRPISVTLAHQVLENIEINSNLDRSVINPPENTG